VLARNQNDMRQSSLFSRTHAVLLLFLAAGIFSAQGAASNSVARVWIERALSAIRQDTPHPPAQARNYFSFSICMYDAWAAYDTNAVGYIYRAKHTAPNIAVARSNAISFAVYRMMKERHAFSRTAATTLTADDNLMTSLGYNINDQSRDTNTATGVGNTIYDAVSLWFSNDGSRGTNGTPYPQANPPIAYPDFPSSDPRAYQYTNRYPLATLLEGVTDGGYTDGTPHTVVDVNHWQRLLVVNAVDQNGFPQGALQSYLGAQWNDVRPFALMRTDSTRPWIDPGPPPYFGGATHAQFVKEAVAVMTAGGQLSPDDGATVDISPRTYGNNSLDFAGDYGTGNFNLYDGHGYAQNPATGQPYAANIVKRGDLSRVLAEYWADGPTSETPPGHWNVLANYLADHPLLVKRIGGTGPVVDDLEWDVKVYFALNAALHDAACACWAAKRDYDGWRPLTIIRYLAGLGQSSNPSLPSYNALGLPLITNQIELVTAASIASGRHAGLTSNKLAVLAWPGPPANPVTQHSGVKWIHADTWIPYQRTNFVTPAFPGYFSGHSTFSRAAAEVLTAITGSPYFPGGLGVYSNYTLAFENGPSAPITLQWATYYDAADQAGISRIWGGIHPPIDNLIGRRAGAQVGRQVWTLAKGYFDGSVTNVPTTITRVGPTQYEVRFTALRGFQYDLRSAATVTGPFTNDLPGTSQPFDELSVARTNTISGPAKFFRAVSRPAP